MKIARAVNRLIEAFEKLPGIGPKSAQRLTFYLLHNPQSELDKFSLALSRLKKDTRECKICFSVGETSPCNICTDKDRDQTQLCAVEQPLDILAVEKGGFYHGLYHVLGGAISPLNNIGPEELHISDLLARLKNGKITELIIATNSNMEGEATAMYIANKVHELKTNPQIIITRIGRGLPVGADLEYADEVTLSRAFEGRREF